MKFITVLALLITTPAFAALFDSIESVDVIQKEIQAKNSNKEDRKPASTESVAPAVEESSADQN